MPYYFIFTFSRLTWFRVMPMHQKCHFSYQKQVGDLQPFRYSQPSHEASCISYLDSFSFLSSYLLFSSTLYLCLDDTWTSGLRPRELYSIILKRKDVLRVNIRPSLSLSSRWLVHYTSKHQKRRPGGASLSDIE